METVFAWISAYGYAAIFLLLMLGIVGLPVPDETLLVFCGALIARGNLHPLAAFFAAAGGSWGGITLSYVIGRTLGLGFVRRFGRYFHLSDERLDQIHKWFDRIGHWALLVGYFVAGVRHFTAIVAGASKLEYPSFAVYAYTGAVLWVTTFLTLGYYVGENWKQIAELLHRYVAIASLAIVAAAVVYFVLRRRKDSA
ncbi:MAG TPA: DedA family protein [Bryobacteraceae bacterium]|nr:DedA family protein [Bryobacteraceae bacterium]